MRTLTAAVTAGALLLTMYASADAKSVSCKKIKSALASGKTADEVASDLKTTTKHVAACQAPAKKHHKKAKKHPAAAATPSGTATH